MELPAGSCFLQPGLPWHLCKHPSQGGELELLPRCGELSSLPPLGPSTLGPVCARCTQPSRLPASQARGTHMEWLLAPSPMEAHTAEGRGTGDDGGSPCRGKPSSEDSGLPGPQNMRELRSKAPVGLSYLEGHTMCSCCLLTLGDGLQAACSTDPPGTGQCWAACELTSHSKRNQIVSPVA